MGGTCFGANNGKIKQPSKTDEDGVFFESSNEKKPTKQDINGVTIPKDLSTNEKFKDKSLNEKNINLENKVSVKFESKVIKSKKSSSKTSKENLPANGGKLNETNKSITKSCEKRQFGNENPTNPMTFNFNNKLKNSDIKLMDNGQDNSKVKSMDLKIPDNGQDNSKLKYSDLKLPDNGQDNTRLKNNDNELHDNGQDNKEKLFKKDKSEITEINVDKYIKMIEKIDKKRKKSSD